VFIDRAHSEAEQHLSLNHRSWLFFQPRFPTYPRRDADGGSPDKVLRETNSTMGDTIFQQAIGDMICRRSELWLSGRHVMADLQAFVMELVLLYNVVRNLYGYPMCGDNWG
jgi:hypothetical protein